MKIKSKRHPDHQLAKHVTMPIMYFRDFEPIKESDFPPMPPISGVELQQTVDTVQCGIIAQTVDMVQRGIIAHSQLYTQVVSAETVNRLAEEMTKDLVVRPYDFNK